MKTAKHISFLSVFILFIFSCNKSSTQGKDYEADQQKSHVSSVSFNNGKYYVDTMIIWRYSNKALLAEGINSKTLVDKKTVEEIPAFILTFLNDVSPNRKFEMANPGQEFRIKDITAFAYPSTLKSQNQNLPSKQLIYFGIDKNTALLSYYCGGLGISQYAAIIKFENERVTDFWFGDTGFAISKAKIVYDLKEKRNNGC